MKRIVFPVLLLLIALGAKAQLLNPVIWSYSSKKIDAKTYELHLTAIIQDNWHVYSQRCGDGPIPTKFVFDPNPLVTTVGEVKEVGALMEKYDSNFTSTLRYFEHKVDFVQVVKLRASVATSVKGTLSF